MAAKKKTEKQAEGANEKKSQKRAYATVEELDAAIDKYFSDCDAQHILYDEAGLALGLGVKLSTLHSWYDGLRCPEFMDPVQMAYLRIQHQIETDPAYMEKNMVSKAIFLLKQKRFGGKQDKIEAKNDINVNVHMGDGMDASDFA